MAKIEPSFNKKRKVLGEILPLDTPLSLIIDVSEACNFRCNYCFRSTEVGENWGFAAKNEIMKWEVLTKVVEQAKEFSQTFSNISLSGHGEPLCNQALPKMARYIIDSGITKNVEIHTNASLLTKENVEKICSSGLTRIVVSLQGLNAEAYKRVCGIEIDYDRLVDNLKLLYSIKPTSLKVHIKVENVALDPNDFEGESERFYNEFSSMADSAYIEQVVPLWTGMSTLGNNSENKYGELKSHTNYCSLLFYKLFIAPDGEIYPCTQLPPPFSLGNVRNVTLVEAWKGKKRTDFLMKHLRETRFGCIECENCFVPQNTITSEADIIDAYTDEIKNRMGIADE